MTSFTPVLPPYPHQVEARDRMRGKNAFALRMEMRTGKTKVILDDYMEMEFEREVQDLLYLSPAGALYGEDALETQALEHMPEEFRERARVFVWRSGMGAKQKRALDFFMAESDKRRPRVLLMNVEALSTVEKSRALAREFLGHRRSVCAVGESTCIKGTSDRTDAVLTFRDLAAYRRIESGCMAPHSPLDLFYQYNFLNPKILKQHSWFGMRARYAITKDVCFLPPAKKAELEGAGRRLPTVKVVVAYRNEEELKELTDPYTYHKRFRDCARAPGGTYRFRDVTMTPEQAKMYKEFKDYATTQIANSEAHMVETVAVTQLLRIHQMVCGFVVDEDKIIHDVPERRTRATLDLCSDHDGQVVIWACYNHNIRKLRAALEKEFGEGSVACFYGDNRAEREQEEREFKAGKRRFQVANPAAGGKGRDWQNASLMLYYSNSPNLEHRDQSEMRIEAVNKLDPVTRIDLRVPEVPADARMIDNLRRKINMASTLQGDGYREWLV